MSPRLTPIISTPIFKIPQISFPMKQYEEVHIPSGSWFARTARLRNCCGKLFSFPIDFLLRFQTMRGCFFRFPSILEISKESPTRLARLGTSLDRFRLSRQKDKSPQGKVCSTELAGHGPNYRVLDASENHDAKWFLRSLIDLFNKKVAEISVGQKPSRLLKSLFFL